MIHFGLFSFVLAFGALNATFVAALLLKSARNRAANRILAALLCVVALRLAPYILGYASFYDVYPWLSFAPFDLPLAIGPLLWLYAARLTSDKMPAGWPWHLAPAALHFVTYFGIFAFASKETKDGLVTSIIDPLIAPALTVAALASLAVYGAKALVVHRAYQQWLDDHLSNREEFRLTWLRRLLQIFALLGMVWLGFAATDLLITPLTYFDEFPFYVAQAAFAWLLGLLAWREAEREYPVPAEPEQPLPVAPNDLAPPAPAPPKPPAEPRGSPDWAALGAQYLEAIESRLYWRDPQLTLTSLARHLGTNTSYLSKALNQGLGQGFNECINRLRVQAVANEIRGGNLRDLVQLGFDAGFNSKASFQRAFVQYMHQTPSAFRGSVASHKSSMHGKQSG